MQDGAVTATPQGAARPERTAPAGRPRQASPRLQARGPRRPSGVAVPALAGLLLLAGCGDLPRPFEGQPGALAMRLSHPPPARLDIASPGESLLSDQGAAVWAVMTRNALVAREIPAITGPNRKSDWRLALSATLHGDQVVPTYTVVNPSGQPQGSTDGNPVPVADWAAGTPDMLRQQVAASGDRIVTLLGNIQAVIAQSDPNSLVNRPARIYLSGVTGAPGDGNHALAAQIRRQLPDAGDLVQDSPSGADFALRGEVHTQADPHGTERIEITWILSDAQGREAGRVAQLNDVPTGSLDQYWGDVALVVAQQAAGGIHDVITNSSGRRKAAAKPATPSAKPGA